jgi:predicted  nucleic acid-binding Zn-ribbon protein
MENQTQTTAPEVAQIVEELATLEARREEIARECQSAQITLKKAKNAAIFGAALETVVEAQTRANAFSSTLEMMESRLSFKRAQLASAQTAAHRAEQETKLCAAALDFAEQRASLESQAREFAEQFESGLGVTCGKGN